MKTNKIGKKGFILADAITQAAAYSVFVIIIIIFLLLFGISFKGCTSKVVEQKISSDKNYELQYSTELINILRYEPIEGEAIADMIVKVETKQGEEKKDAQEKLKIVLDSFLTRISEEGKAKGLKIQFSHGKETYGRTVKPSIAASIKLPIPESDKMANVDYYDEKYFRTEDYTREST